MKRPDVHDALSKSDWLSELPSDVSDAVLSRGRMRLVRANGEVYHAGQPPTGLHAIASGEVRITTVTAAGQEPIIRIARPGDWIGFLSCIDHKPHVFSAIASIASWVYCIPADAVAEIFEDNVILYRSLVLPELAASRTAYLYAANLATMSPEMRVAARLVDLSCPPYCFDGPYSALERLSQDQLAMSAMVSRQTANMILRGFEARRLIRLGYNRVKILDAEGLRQITDAVR